VDATLQLPEGLARSLEKLAGEEGTSVDSLIRRLVSEHLERRRPLSAGRREINLPLIPRGETGVVSPVTGSILDEMFSGDHLSS